MTWIKLDTGLPGHDRIIDLDPTTRWVYIAALCYSGEHLTDGLIRRTRLRFVDVTIEDLDAHAAALVAAGLWNETDDGWQIAHYLDHQRSADDVRRQRAAAKERTARLRTVRANIARTNAVTNAVTAQDVTPNVRVQSRGEKNAHTAPVIHNDPQVIHRCGECDQPVTDEGCYCTDQATT